MFTNKNYTVTVKFASVSGLGQYALRMEVNGLQT